MSHLSELEEVKYLQSLATYPSIKQLLKQYEDNLLSSSISSTENSNNNNNLSSEISPEILSESTTPQIQNNNSTTTTTTTTTTTPVIPVIGRDQIYTPITDFAWDQGGYNSDTVTIYVELPNVGNVKDNVNCSFTATSFDLVVPNLEGKNYRLIKDNLEKDIVPEKSKFVVKKNKVIIKLHKVKGEYSYEHWANLTAKKSRDKVSDKKDPSASIMDMMRDMYNEGDDNMKKIIGESMLKSRNGEKMDMPAI